MVGGATGPITKAISRRRSHRRQWRIFECIAMIILDAILIDASFRVAYYFRYVLLRPSSLLDTLAKTLIGSEFNSTFFTTPLDNFAPLEFGIVIGLIVIFILRGLYTIRLTGSWFRQARTILNSATVGLTLLIAYYFVFPAMSNSRLLVPFVWATAVVVLCLARLIVSGVMVLLYRIGLGETRLLVVGSGRLGKMIMQHIAANPDLGYSIVGFLHDLQHEPPSDFGRFKMLGTIDDIGYVIRSMQVDEVIIALPSNMHQYAVRSVKMCERLGTSFKLVPELYELSLSRIDMGVIEGIPLLGIRQVALNSIQRFITRLVDVTVSILVLTLSSPIWLCIALIIKLSSQGPIIFKQKRVGLNGKLFEIYKFRSMYQNADQRLATLLEKNEATGPLFKMKDDPRITPIGKFIRRTSLDEVPQLINVIKGDMSLVGPRPALQREVEQYEEWQKGRLAIRPGLTGLWQVRGRSNLSFDEGVLMDLYYIENWSLRLYFQILFRTIPAVLFSRGAY
ncbi:sugar transferase [Ktedonosporobacter rubrisoli]|uniref:Sugar transferase n=1 Tax=Ktedonosporobacter rubrisoli TaxID=2509675 RepID=A0A4P6JSF2_KTERU|nr:sugar transferase [Ktedonosporobacter rubrisoli]QBD78447.1 sugar transferase [Ktedonosporobacter rubrisoli]